VYFDSIEIILLLSDLSCIPSSNLSPFLALFPSKMMRLQILVLLLLTKLTYTTSFVLNPSSVTTRRYSKYSILNGKSSNGDDVDDDAEEFDLSGRDWRAFRAKLVMGESQATAAATKTDNVSEDDDLDGIGSLFGVTAGSISSSSFDPDQWAYESGKVIEQGAVILGGVEQDYGFGLRQQYFHKAAILVLDHQEATFTKGIILNRPTEITLPDTLNNIRWKVWFGGDVQGLDSTKPDIICLHSLDTPPVTEVSTTVLRDIQWTSFHQAKKLVHAGHAKPSDFWVFCGYAGWGPGQLLGELDRQSWYMVATDSQTLLQEMARLATTVDARDAGLDTWTMLMKLIGREKLALEETGTFDDYMLKEWARENLLPKILPTSSAVIATERQEEIKLMDPMKELRARISSMQNQGKTEDTSSDFTPGHIVRASSQERSPYLLQSQELHKSVVLIISDDALCTVGVVLNRPAAKGLDIRIKASAGDRVVTLPLRYGGQYTVKGQEPLLWLHNSDILRQAKIGSPVGKDGFEQGIWKCTASDVTKAVKGGLASPTDFVVVSGVSLWPKKGLQGELLPQLRKDVMEGKFVDVDPKHTKALWSELTKQEVLSASNLDVSLTRANAVWDAAVGGHAPNRPPESADTPRKDEDDALRETEPVLIGGLGEGFDEEDHSLVYNTDVKVRELSDKALRTWLATFLLGKPSL
jgi:putative AlgH/UPF0301 family transcriptional regulator